MKTGKIMLVRKLFVSVSLLGILLPSSGFSKKKDVAPLPVMDSIQAARFMDSIHRLYLNEVNFIIDHIENTYISGRRGMSDEEWSILATIAYENTSKHTLSYDFADADKIEAFRFTYHKEKGNLAIDDVVITYGKNDTVFVDELRTVTTTEALFTGLEAPATYYYRVRAVKDDYRSEWSPTGMVVTDPNVEGSAPLYRQAVPCSFRITDNTLSVKKSSVSSFV